jgi:hypothetical protein
MDVRILMKIKPMNVRNRRMKGVRKRKKLSNWICFEYRFVNVKSALYTDLINMNCEVYHFFSSHTSS